jgi:hypothetical protein
MTAEIGRSEYGEQCAVFEWCELTKGRAPELGLLFHIPNGEKRDKATAARLKKAGVKAGVCDLFLPVARGGNAGLFIEMKAGGGKPTKDQEWWIESLRGQGYAAAVCHSAGEAIAAITEYLRGRPWAEWQKEMLEWKAGKHATNGTNETNKTN